MEIVAGVAWPTAGAPVIIEKMNQGRGDRRRLRGLSVVEKIRGKKLRRYCWRLFMCAYKCGINLAPYWEPWYIPTLLNHRHTADTSNYCLAVERHKICPGGDRIVRLLQFQQFRADYRLMKYLLDDSGLKTINRLYAAWKLFVKILPWGLVFYESHIAFARQSVW